MASGPVIFAYKTRLNFFSATNLLSTANTFKLALVSSAWTPAVSTDEVWADVSANEIANGNGYTTGGGTLANDALTQTSGVVKFTTDAFVWTATGGSIPAWRYGVIYASGTLNSKVNPIVGYFLGDSTPADVPATTVGNTLTVTPNTSGLYTSP